MANTLRIKRRVGGSAGAPTSLENAEIAFNETSEILYYGQGTGGAGGTATAVIAIAGKGAFVDVNSTQTVGGTKTFSNTISGSIDGNAGTATTLATSRNFSASGDATAPNVSFNGSAAVDLVLTLANSGVSAGTYTKLTVDSKGRATVGAQASLSDLSAATGDFSMGGFKLTNLAEPTVYNDAATKNYVDSVAQGLDVKASVVAATTGNITLSGEQTIDGVSVVAGDRVLVKNQSAQADNGIYVASASAWARAADMNAWAEVPGAFTFVEQGSTNGDTGWVCTSNQGGTLGSTAIVFAQFSASGSYVAGSGLTLTGNSFSVNVDDSTIAISSGNLQIKSTYAGQSSITTLGTISTGTWQGTAIGVAYGGLGLTSAVSGLLKGSSGTYSAATVDVDYLSPNSTIDGGTF